MKNRVPLVLGVIGDPLGVEEGAVKKAVEGYIRELHQSYPNTPILLLSTLTEKTERWAVDAAFSTAKDLGGKLEVELVAVLPKDGATVPQLNSGKESRPPLGPFKLPDKFPALPPDVARGDIQRLLAGAFVVRNCHVLLAVAEKLEYSEGPKPLNSTALFFDLQTDGRLEVQGFDGALLKAIVDVREVFSTGYGPLETPDVGPVVLLRPPITRDGSLTNDRLPPARYEKEPARHREIFLRSYGENIESLNRKITEVCKDPFLKATTAELNRMLPEGTEIKDNEALKSLQNCRETYAVTDRAAIELQSSLDRAMKRALRLIFLAVVCFSAFAHLAAEEWHHCYLLPYAIFLTGAYGCYVYYLRSADILHFLRHKYGRLIPRCWHGHDEQDRFQDTRTLSEGLRVLFYWRLAGIEDSVADHYLTRQKNELDWIRSATRAWSIMTEVPPAAGAIPGEEERLRAVGLIWVVGQLNYFIKSAYRDRVQHIVWRQAGAGLLAAGLGFSVVLFFIKFHENDGFWRPWNQSPAGIVQAGFLAFVSLMLWLVVRVKFIETIEEKKDDQEEMDELHHQIGVQKRMRGFSVIEPPSKLPKELGDYWFLWPLHRWITCGGFEPRKVGKLPWLAFFYGTGFGIFIIGGMCMIVPWGLSHIRSVVELPAVNGFLARYLDAKRLVGFSHHPLGLKVGWGEDRMDWLIVVVVLNVALAALVQWYGEKRAFAAHYRQYKRMVTIFLRAYERLMELPKSSGTPNESRKILMDLGCEALREHADWLLLHRDRPVEFPKLEL
jgi:hypothetical protein